MCQLYLNCAVNMTLMLQIHKIYLFIFIKEKSEKKLQKVLLNTTAECPLLNSNEKHFGTCEMNEEKNVFEIFSTFLHVTF